MSTLVTKKLTINGMHCVSCSMNIDFELEDIPGVKTAKTSYAKQECEVVFDEELVSIDIIRRTIEKTGYKSTIIPENNIH